MKKEYIAPDLERKEISLYDVLGESTFVPEETLVEETGETESW